jgi:hypothetical protein
MLEANSSALMMALFINKNLLAGNLKLSKDNPRIFLLSPSLSDYFAVGLDTNWAEAAVDYENGRLYLCIKSMDTNELLLGFSIAFRVKRLNVIWAQDLKDNPHAVLNMKKISTEKTKHGDRTVVGDEHIFTGIKLSRVNSASELFQTAYDDNYANLLLQESGLDESFTSF